MVMLYLDIETLSLGEEPSVDDKVIAIGVSVDGKKMFWKEWDAGEKELINQFYKFLESLTSKERTVWIIGFNILKFDIPILIYKVLKFGLRGYSEIFELWHNCYIEDERQILLPFNDFRFKHLSAEDVHRALEKIFEEEIKEGQIRIRKIKHSGSEIPEFYKRSEFEKILEHLSSDLDFLADLHYLLKFRFDFLASERHKFMRALCQS